MRKKRERVAASAELPERMQVGRVVWIWDLCACEEDGCLDAVSVTCPLNHGTRWNEPAAASCRRNHPRLRRMEIWAVCVYFDERDITYVINDSWSVPVSKLDTIYETQGEALRHKPGVVF